MKIRFIGVGEAFDANNCNTTISVEFEGKILLLDCGYNSLASIQKYFPDPESIDFIYLSHWHADHAGGIAPLFTYWWEEKRKKPIRIIGQTGTESFIKNYLTLMYPDITWTEDKENESLQVYSFSKLTGKRKQKTFEIYYDETDSEISIPPFQMKFCKTAHSRINYAVRVEIKNSNQEYSIVYSGDGAPINFDFYRNADLMIQECYYPGLEIPGHCDIKSLHEITRRSNIQSLALVHIYRNIRFQMLQDILQLKKDIGMNTFIPEAGEVYEFN